MQGRKERLEKAIAHLKGKQIVSSNQDIIDSMQVNKSSFSQAVNGKENYLTENFVVKFCSTFPIFCKDWLWDDKGPMLKTGDQTILDDSPVTGKVIPLYDAEAAAGSNYGMDLSPVTRPSGMIEIGALLKDSESAIRVYGNSMVPNYPAGCVIGTKPHTDSFIEPGAVYVIETRDNRYLKRVYYNEEKDCLECESDNHMIHEEGSRKGKPYYPMFKIPCNEVVALHRVTGVIKRNIL